MIISTDGLVIFVTLICFEGNFIHSARTLNGRYTKSIENYRLIIPHKLSEDGNFVSFHVPQYYENLPQKIRRKRSHSNEDKTHFGVTINKKDYHVELWPNTDFLSPNLVIENRDPKSKVQDKKFRTLEDKHACHYTGHVRGVPNSRAALSTCDGLTGYVIVDNVRYFVEPVDGHQANKQGHHLHVVYTAQPSMNSIKRSSCGTTDDWEDIWKDRFRELHHKDNKHVRVRGTVSINRYLEVTVVADKKFLQYHKSRDVETYVLTIMNMVSDFYHDYSSGQQMDVSIVRIIYLEKEEEEIDLQISVDGAKTLESFCKWQHKINPPDIENPNHHDIGVLLTRYDICVSDAGCGLTGIANVAAACSPELSCAVNEDSGLALGIVVAHEMGHVMGCSHDKEGESECTAQDKDGSYFIMSPFINLFTLRWSECSRQFIAALFDAGLGECLNDEPQASMYKFTGALPGTIYDANEQCNINFPSSKLCPQEPDNFCSLLMCQTEPNSCLSGDEPPADGTKCGENKWCYHKKCVRIGQRPDAINGGWGSYSSWSECSRTCGGGVSVSERQCNNPIPQHNGKYCLGERKKIKLCNMTPCPPNTPSFRELQCSAHDKKPFKEKLHTWKTHLSLKEPCVLYCINEEKTLVKLEPRVKDGTPCKHGTRNICIANVCRTVGCDNKLDSEALDDICGICNGDGTQCKVVEGTFKDVVGGYKKIATVPAGSRNIHFDELGPSENMLAVSDNSEKNFYLNGNFLEETDGEYYFGKTIGLYTHPEPGKESLLIRGPTTEDLILFAVFFEKTSPGFRYKYAEPTSDLNYTPQYHWELLEWEECSAKCGGGTQNSLFQCVEDKAGKVSPTFCPAEEKPATSTKKCNEQPCKKKWKVGKWSKCMACKKLSGIRVRQVVCVEESTKPGAEDTLLEDDKCDEVKPASRELCNSPNKCRSTRYVDNIPKQLLKDVWKQTDRKSWKRDADLGSIVKALDGSSNMDSCHKNKTNVTLKVGSTVLDRVPEKEIKLIRFPLKPSKLAQNLSDEAFKQMGDAVADTIDTAHGEIVTGKDAAEMLKELRGSNDTTTSKPKPQTTKKVKSQKKPKRKKHIISSM